MMNPGAWVFLSLAGFLLVSGVVMLCIAEPDSAKARNENRVMSTVVRHNGGTPELLDEDGLAAADRNRISGNRSFGWLCIVVGIAVAIGTYNFLM